MSKKDEALKLAQKWQNTDWNTESPMSADNAVSEADAVINALIDAQAELPAQQQDPVGRTDQQIVDQTEELAVWLLHWAFNRQPETPTPMRESRHPMAKRCWAAACHIQEMLTATDPENAVSELDGEAPEDTSPQPSKPWVGLTDEDIGRCFDAADGTMGGLITAIEAKLREKNGG